MWQVMTHLNPAANDLVSFARDLISLADGNSILNRHYDHATGKRQRPSRISSNDFVVASGLHAFYLPICRDCYDLTVYLDMSEPLRRFYKVRRDTTERGYSAATVIANIEKRDNDSTRFIRSQAIHADLVISLQPINDVSVLAVRAEDPKLKIVIHSRKALYESPLARVLVGVCGLHVDNDVNEESGTTTMTIEGDARAEDVRMAASLLFPRIIDFLDTKADWKDGVPGIMQLIVLANINQALSRRLI
jgi:uridine kinase